MAREEKLASLYGTSSINLSPIEALLAYTAACIITQASCSYNSFLGYRN